MQMAIVLKEGDSLEQTRACFGGTQAADTDYFLVNYDLNYPWEKVPTEEIQSFGSLEIGKTVIGVGIRHPEDNNAVILQKCYFGTKTKDNQDFFLHTHGRDGDNWLKVPAKDIQSFGPIGHLEE